VCCDERRGRLFRATIDRSSRFPVYCATLIAPAARVEKDLLQLRTTVYKVGIGGPLKPVSD
jgi:hypothetical protein